MGMRIRTAGAILGVLLGGASVNLSFGQAPGDPNAPATQPAEGGRRGRGGGGGGGGRGQPPAVPLPPTTSQATRGNSFHNVTNYGAVGNGQTIDSDAINRAINAAHALGGGTVYFPPGVYHSYTIRLKSNITLHLDHGARILAAPVGIDGKGYDLAEPNPEGGGYQDGGHSHWKNSLIWAIGEQNIAIEGHGIIDGSGLATGDPGTGGGRGGGFGPGGGRGRGGRGRGGDGAGPATQPDAVAANQDAENRGGGGRRGDGGGRGRGDDPNAPPPTYVQGNKALALKLCRNVTIRDVSFYRGGHFAIIATGVDNMTVSNVKFDTNRDAFNIDSCRNMRVSDCSVNSPNDDAIVLKSSFGLGFARACENITITNCLVSGYEIGTLLDGTYKPLDRRVPDGMGPTGRIKFGTESNGGFKNITISNITFDHCRGLALETVDGGLLEDVTITNITMRNTSNSPIFLRLGARMRGPDGVPVGELRRVNISNIVVYNADPRYASIIAGIPGHHIEDVKLSNIWIQYKGGGTAEQAAINPPEDERGYPEPARLGEMPAYGFFIRHVKNIEMNNIEISYVEPEVRPAFVMEDVIGIELNNVKAQIGAGIPRFVLRAVENFTAFRVRGVPDTHKAKVAEEKF